MIVQKSTVDEEGYFCEECCDCHVVVWVIQCGGKLLYLCEECKDELAAKLTPLYASKEEAISEAERMMNIHNNTFDKLSR